MATRNVDVGDTEGKTHQGADTPQQPPRPPFAIVFTDIVKSTAIWEKNPTAMAEAMTIHDDLLRDLITAHSGYEVKQNGDGFMLAFQSAVSALNFCLDVQIQLQEQKWPQELLEIGPAQPIVEEHGENDEEEVLWRGLRLRMSAHFGETVCNWNEVTQRMDYLGPAVNRAARFVSVCEGGQIVVSEEFLQELNQAASSTAGGDGGDGGDGPLFENAQTADTVVQENDQRQLEDLVGTRFEVRTLGDRHFKGVAEKQRLFFIIPKPLQGRLKHFPQHKYVQASKGNLTEGG